jgi:hypothetical protein
MTRTRKRETKIGKCRLDSRATHELRLPAARRTEASTIRWTSLPPQERKRLRNDLDELFDYLDDQWDRGALPQRFSF